jgi:outer membrane protein assembly factor BamB/class 3 adenylate cyclase
MTGADRTRAAEHRTFLIADIRGYTKYTDEHGDEAAGALAKRFAELSTQAVEGHEGVLLELRGDEALAHFASAREALRAAIELQRLVAKGKLPRGVGIGLDAGEAVAVAGGYRGTALNLASRLCSRAAAGEILATETVAHLAARIEGIRYVAPRTVRLDGFEAPVRIIGVVASDGPTGATERVQTRGRFRGVDRRATGLAAAVVVAVLGFGVWAIAQSGLRLGAGSLPSGCGSGGTLKASASAGATSDVVDVPAYKGGLGRTNVMPGPGPTGEPFVDWQFEVASDPSAQPVVAGGKVYAADADGILHVLDFATHKEEWSFAAGAPITVTPAIAADSVYVTSRDGVLHSVDLSGHQERWRASGASEGDPAVVGDTLYLGLASGRLAALAIADGCERWSVPVNGDASHAAIVDGTAYVAGEGTDLVYAVDLANHTVRWRVAIGTTVVITPAVLDGTVYVVGIDPAGRDSHVSAIDATTGIERWRWAPTDRAPLTTLAVSDRHVYTSADLPAVGTSLYAIDRLTGKLSWKVDLRDRGPIRHPAIADGHLFVASATGILRELDAANGNEIWQDTIGGSLIGGPVVTGGLAIVATAPGSTSPGGLLAVGSRPLSSAPKAPVPVKWLEDLTAGDDKPALYLNVAVDSQGNVYAPDGFNHRVVIWDRAGKPTLWGKRGDGPGEFDFSEVTPGDQSMSVAIAPDGRIAVGDGGNHRVQIFDATRRFLMYVGQEGSRRGEFINPCCVAFDAQGLLYVADPGRNDIQVFADTGAFIRMFGIGGSGNYQFRRLGVPYVDPGTGNIWVPDFANHRVQVVATDGSFIAAYGNVQNGGPGLAEVNGVVLDDAGRMYIVDTLDVVSVLDPSGRLLWQFGPSWSEAGRVSPPYLALTANGELYLPDVTGSGRVVVLQLEPPLWPPP